MTDYVLALITILIAVFLGYNIGLLVAARRRQKGCKECSLFSVIGAIVNADGEAEAWKDL